MSERAKAAAARIREHVPIVRVLVALGYEDIRADGGEREQQFRCDLHGSGQDNTPSARVYPDSNDWYCVSIADRVLTSVGWVPLGDTKHKPPTLDGAGLFHSPLAYLDRGSKACVTVRTRFGYQVTLTSDHEVAVRTEHGWCEAGKLKPGDELVVPLPQEECFNPDTALPVKASDFNRRPFRGQPYLTVPKQWSLALGEALGYIFGDGWVTPRPKGSSGVVGITSSAEDVADAREVFRNLQAWSGGRGCEVHRQGKVHTPNGAEYIEDQFVFSVGNDGFCEWFQRMGLAKSGPPQDRRLPDSIWSAPREGVVGFLRGMYATDGSVFRPKDRKGVRVNLYSVSEGFLQDVQMLLLQCGIRSRLYRPAKTRPGGVWYLQLATGKDILAFRAKIGFANNRKQAVLDSFEYNPRGARPHRVIVESVTPTGVLPVADITMPGTPSFVVGGIKVHNCFGCGSTRDAIETVRAKQDVGFWQAVKVLEQAFGLDPLPIDYGNDERGASAIAEALDNLRHHTTYDDEEKRTKALLNGLTRDRDIAIDRLLAFWEAFDKAVFHVKGPRGDGGVWSESRGKKIVAALRERILEKVLETNKA